VGIRERRDRVTNVWTSEKTWEEKHDHWVELAEKFARKRSRLIYIEDMKDAILSLKMQESTKKHVAAQKRDAEASKAYRGWCVQRRKLVEATESLRLQLQAGEIWFERSKKERNLSLNAGE
jgi:hypothetical protein